MKNRYALKSFLSLLTFLISTVSFSQTTYNYTGGPQSYIVPAGVTSINVECWGAQGGGNPAVADGGLGGYVSADITVTPGQTINIYVGGQGIIGGPGGYNGGGSGIGNSSNYGGSGGGASDIRIGGLTLSDRVVVAGAGGGGMNNANPAVGADGGGLIGADGLLGSNGWGCTNLTMATGGTQSAGGLGGTSTSCAWDGTDGSFGVGGDSYWQYACSGGGGGWYGGGGAHNGSSGAGGSSYTIPTATNVVHVQGDNAGNGQVIITELCAALTTTISATDVCEDELVTLSATSVGGGTITWNNGISDGVAFLPPVGTTTYTATSSDIGDCLFSVDITVNLSPVVDAGQDVLICGNIVDTALTATGTGDTFTWNNGITDGIQFTPTVGSTEYIVTAEYTATGCQATDTVFVTVGDPTVSLTSTDEMLGNDGTIDLTILSGAAPFTYDWDNDGVGDNDDVDDLTGIPTGSYTVIVTDASGCTTTETIIVGSQVGLDEENLNSSVYPNPTSGIINIELNGNFSYKLVNTQGQIVVQGAAINLETLDVNEFESGMYLLRIEVEGSFLYHKIVKE